MRPRREASGTYGPRTSRSSAPITGMLTAFETRPPSSAAATCSATITPARSCASPVDAARCGVTTTLSSSAAGRSTARRRRRRGRRRRPCQSAEPRAARPRRAASRAPRSRSARRRRICSNTAAPIESRASRGSAGVQGDEVSDRVDAPRRLDALDAELAEAFRRHVRVVGDDPHPEPQRAPRDLLPDPAEAEHAERLARQLDAAVASCVPSGPA